MKKAKTLKRNHTRDYTKRRLTNKKRFTKKKYTKKIQRGGVCPCAVPLSATVTSYVATVLGGLGIYSLKNKKKKRKKPKK
jgi:hypothetical protein